MSEMEEACRNWSKAQTRGISRSLPGKKTELNSSTQKSYIKSTSHCLILYQSIVGEPYIIISEGKFTLSTYKERLEKANLIGIIIMVGNEFSPDVTINCLR